jgi:hypothetical protein
MERALQCSRIFNIKEGGYQEEEEKKKWRYFPLNLLKK